MVVIFDIGSTLIEGPPFGPARRLSEMLELDAEAIPKIEKLLFQTPSKDAAHLARQIGKSLDVDREQVKSACSALWEAQLEEAYVIPGAREVIDALRSARIPRAYLSNIWPPFYECFRREFSKEAERPQVLSFQSGKIKPDKSFFEDALKAIKARPEDVLMVGDTYRNDIRPAIDLGMRTAWVLHRPQKERASLAAVLNQLEPAPDITLKQIAELTPQLVKDILKSPRKP